MTSSHQDSSHPWVLYADEAGQVYEDQSLYALGRSGYYTSEIDESDWIELPEGGSLYQLKGRRTIGKDVETGEVRPCMRGWAVAAFIPPAHTGLYLAPYINEPDAPTLPLFCLYRRGMDE